MCQRHAEIARDHEPLVEDSIENIQKTSCSGNSWNSLHNISGKYRRDRLGTVTTRATHAPHPNQPRRNCQPCSLLLACAGLKRPEGEDQRSTFGCKLLLMRLASI